MKIEVKYFGLIAELVGADSQQIEFAGSTISELKSQLEQVHQRLSEYTYLVAVNQEIGKSNQVLSEKDEIAFLPPFAGG